MPDTNELHEEYYECSIASSNETADNLPGHGRLLGNVYVFLGRHLEYSVGMVAGKMGFGPKAIALKIRRIQEDKTFLNPTKYRKLEKYSKRSVRYLSSEVLSNQEQALDNIINLGIMEPHLRETLRMCAVPKIAQIQRMSAVWCRTNGSVHVKALRALTILDDSRVNYLANVIFSDYMRVNTQAFDSACSELELYYSNPDSSFLVLRYMSHRFRRDYFVKGVIQRYLLALFVDATNRSMDKIRYLEHTVEWPVFDEFLSFSLMLVGFRTRSEWEITHFHSPIIDVILRNADKLPLSLQKFGWVQDLEAHSSNRIVNAYAILFKYYQFLQDSPGYDPSKYPGELAISIEQRLNNSLDMALAEICAEYIDGYINNNHIQIYSMSHIRLVEALNSDDQVTHQHALRNISVVLSVNRYARLCMLRALDSHIAPSKKSYRSIIEKIKPIPQFNPRPYYEEVTRHVDTKGRIIHLEYPTYYTDSAGSSSKTIRCNGECGSVEEHVMRGGVIYKLEEELYKRMDYMLLKVNPEDPLSIAGHLPILAGSAADGGKLFVAWNFLDNRIIFHAVTDGTRPRDLRFRTHYSDGSTREGDLYPQESMATMSVNYLRYDPFVYGSDNSPSLRSDGMDATGPFSWKFSRKLPAERSEDEKRYYSSVKSPRILWNEIIHEPEQYAHIQKLADNTLPIDNVIIPQEVTQEANV